jgi:ferredoxin
MKKLFSKKSIVLLVVTLISITTFAAYILTSSYKTYLIDMETCINCQACIDNYPEIFKYNEDYKSASWVNSTGIHDGWATDYLVLTEPFPTAIITSIEDAITICPTQSIINGDLPI